MQGHNQSSPAFLSSTPLVSPISRSPQSLPPNSAQPLVCVSRPETSSNVFTVAITLISNLFRRPSPSQLVSSDAKPLPENASPDRDPSSTSHSNQAQGRPRVLDQTQVQAQDRNPTTSPLSATIDTDGLQSRLRARADNDGVKSRITARRSGTSRSPRALPTRAQKRRRSSPFPFFSRPSDRPVYPSALARLSDERIVFLLENAFQRRHVSPPNPDLVTLLPYDLQRALFDELTGNQTDISSSSGTVSDPPFPAKAKSREVDQNGKSSSIWDISMRFATDAFRFATFQPERRETGANDSPQSPDNESAAAYTAAAMASETAVAFEASSENNLAAAAYAAATAIATSTASQLHPEEIAGLQAAVTAARAVANTEDATTFVNTVGLAALVTAAHSLSGTQRAGALTALANIAIVLPKVRVSMLTAKRGLIIDTIVDIVYRSARFHMAQSVGGTALWYTEALVSGTHLLGSLGLAKGKIGSEFRKKMAKDVDLVRRLQSLAEGMKNGEAEGAARAARRALGVLGVNQWKPRVPGQRGLRILSIDGGGTRAILAFETVSGMSQFTWFLKIKYIFIVLTFRFFLLVVEAIEEDDGMRNPRII